MFRAVCIGVNYPTDANSRLYGCANDAANVSSYFRRLGYDVTMLVDEAPTAPVAEGVQVRMGPQYTTRAAILGAIRQLRDASSLGGVRGVAITYSGHGTYITDRSSDETDGRDEAWVPGDYKTSGLILDDELATLFRGFHSTTRIFVMSDACHSGTAIDLPFQYDANMNASYATRKYVVFPSRILHISGCRDQQTSADAWNVEGFTGSTGALTACFLSTLYERGVGCPLGTLLQTINGKLMQNQFSQRSLLTSTVRVGAFDTLRLTTTA